LKKKRKLKHRWVPASSLLSTETATYLVCKRCGYVQNDKNVNAQCKGRVKMRQPEKPL